MAVPIEGKQSNPAAPPASDQVTNRATPGPNPLDSDSLTTEGDATSVSSGGGVDLASGELSVLNSATSPNMGSLITALDSLNHPDGIESVGSGYTVLTKKITTMQEQLSKVNDKLATDGISGSEKTTLTEQATQLKDGIGQLNSIKNGLALANDEVLSSLNSYLKAHSKFIKENQKHIEASQSAIIMAYTYFKEVASIGVMNSKVGSLGMLRNSLAEIQRKDEGNPVDSQTSLVVNSHAVSLSIAMASALKPQQATQSEQASKYHAALPANQATNTNIADDAAKLAKAIDVVGEVLSNIPQNRFRGRV